MKTLEFNDEEIKNLSIRMPASLYKKLRQTAFDKEKSISLVINHLLEQFLDYSPPPASDPPPLATIGKYPRIRFNQSAQKLIGDYQYATLHYTGEQIEIDLYNDRVDQSYKISDTTAGRFITSMRFINKHGLQQDKLTTYPVAMKEGRLLIELNAQLDAPERSDSV